MKCIVNSEVSSDNESICKYRYRIANSAIELVAERGEEYKKTSYQNMTLLFTTHDSHHSASLASFQVNVTLRLKGNES